MRDQKNVVEYLGDSVYAEFDGFGLRLYLDNGAGKKSKIYLEPDVVEKLDKFKESMFEKFSMQNSIPG